MTAAASVRDAQPADIPRLLELYLQLSEQSEFPEDAPRPATEEHQAALARIAADPNARLLVLEVERRVAGTLALYILPNLSHGGRPFALVENVVVDATLRGAGYGRLLMERAEALAAAAGCYKVALLSNSKRAPAHAFYERIGFNPTHVGFTRYADQH
ncbi:MAG TPA: GNAT family N-acetyltransferase [Dehalococcoidia bacterium]|jgi:GNAT superfamily N-acetyltransferase|nr:GNAT family N-acetyltransferase [Dehalococcoidia bacterium]